MESPRNSMLLLCLVTKSCWTVCDPVDCLQPHGLQPARLLCPWDFPSKNTIRVCCHFLLQGICPTQGLNSLLLCWLADSSPLSQQENPEILYDIPYMWNLKRNDTNELKFQNRDSQIQRTVQLIALGRGWGVRGKGGWVEGIVTNPGFPHCR